MKRLLSIAAVLALAAARPETYKETEDFQYARSSTDEGSKSGYYGARRGNMGGNFERAHNMDGLAQHQMGSAVKQVEGELGEASNLKSGSVYTSANSGGMFGSGHYDVSNLGGRNFQESVGHSSADSLSQASSLQSQHLSSMHNSEYNSSLSDYNTGHSHNSAYRGYQGLKNNGQSLQNSNLQFNDNVHDANYDYGTSGARISQSTGHASQSGYQSHSAYGSSNDNQYRSQSYGTNPQNRLVYATPVKIVGRPGSRVAVPVGVQTYDATHSASILDHNAINSEAEILNTADQHVAYRPVSNAKHYESSYNYRKQWEKHDVQTEVIPLAIPTENPIPKNSELYDDTQISNNQYAASGINSQSGYSNNMHTAHNSNVKSSSASQLHQSAANSHLAASSSDLNTYSQGGYNLDNSADTTNGLGDVTKPKAYQSSYSYHKAWERQGDPYVIKPVGGTYAGLDSQRLTSATNSHGYSSHQGSNYQQTHGSYVDDCDCDVNGHVRVSRSVRNLHAQEQNEDLSQQTQTSWNHIQEMGQQTQNGWNKLDAYTQDPQQQEDLVQQVQQNKWDNLEDLEQQQTLNSWNRLEDLRQAQYAQQSEVRQQNKHNFGQQIQQNKRENLEELGQQVQQQKWDNLEDLGQQQTLKSWDRLEDLRKEQNARQTQVQQEAEQDFGQQVQQNKWDNFESIGQVQRHGAQDRDIWSGYTSEPRAFDNQAQQSNNFDVAWSPTSSQDKQDHLYSNSEAGEQIVPLSTSFNQEQQSSSNMWIDQHQQKIETNRTLDKPFAHTHNNHEGSESLEYMYLGSQDREEMEQVNQAWGVLEYMDQHNNNNQQHDVTVPTQGWNSIVNQENQKGNQSDKVAYGFYDWSQVSADKSNTDRSTLGNLWNKISNADNQSNIQSTGNEHGNNSTDLVQHHVIQQTIINKTCNNSSTEKPHSVFGIYTTTEGQVVVSSPQQDIGRGDIGPEDDVIEKHLHSDSIQYNKTEAGQSVVLAKENNISHVTGHLKQENKKEENLDQWIQESHKLNSTINQTQQSLWGQEYVYVGNYSKNKTDLHQDRRNQIFSNTDNSNKLNKAGIHSTEHIQVKYDMSNDNNKGASAESIPELTVEDQRVIPPGHLRQPTYKTVNTNDRINPKIITQSDNRYTQFAQSNSSYKYEHNFKVEDTQLINENYDQELQQSNSLNDNETVWGQSLKEFMQMPQKQENAEAFGVIVEDEQPKPKTTPETSLEENFKRETVESLDNVYNSNHNLPHYKQEPKTMQSSESRVNLQVPVEPTTSKPGFWRNAKTKFVSWFKSSD